MAPAFARSLVPIAAASVMVVACSGSGSTGPAGSKARTYVAVLNVAGDTTLGGLLILDRPAGAALARAERPARLDAASLFVKPLWAQTGQSATGTLITDGGDVVSLSGTYSNQVFTLSGGGYTVAATVSASGTVSGSGTAPGGMVGAVAPAASVTNASSIAKGTYKATFTINNVMSNKETNTAGTQITGYCAIKAVITGTAIINIEDVKDSDVSVHMDLTWTETTVLGSGLPGLKICTFQQNNSPGTHGLDYDGPASAVSMIRISSFGGGSTRTQGFVGGVTSGGTIVGTVLIGYKGVVPISGGIHTEWFPVTRATVTLTKQ